MTAPEAVDLADAARELLGPAEVGRAAGQPVDPAAAARIVLSARLRRTVLGLSDGVVEAARMDVLRRLAAKGGIEGTCLRAEALLRRGELRRTVSGPDARAARDRFGAAVVEWAVSWDGDLPDDLGEGAGLGALHAWLTYAGPSFGGLLEIVLPDGAPGAAVPGLPPEAIEAAVRSDAA